MAMLTEERNTVQIANDAHLLSLPVKGKTTIYQGAMVAVDKDGFAVPGAKAAGLTAVGRAEQTINNTAGADGDLAIAVRRGVFVYGNSSTAADKITQAHVMGLCYWEDDQTVTAAADGSSAAGRVLRVDEEGVAVELGMGAGAGLAAAP